MRPILSLTMAALLFAATSVVQAGDGCDSKSGCHGTVKCPKCAGCCDLSVSKDKETRTCYGVECEQICIPRVVFPWQKKDCGKKGACDSGCDGKHVQHGKCGHDLCPEANCSPVNNGAKSRYVRVLKKYEYECTVCKYKWSPDGKKGYDAYKDGDKKAADNVIDGSSGDNTVPPPPPIDARSNPGGLQVVPVRVQYQVAG